MERRSLGKQIWEIFSPILVRAVVIFVVEFVIVSVYCVQYMPEMLELVKSQEDLMEKMIEITEGIYQYVVEITAIASLVTIPFFVYMRKKDLKQLKSYQTVKTS